MKKSMGGVQNDDLTSISKRIKLKEEIFSAVNKNKPEGSSFKRMDYSAFRTPSGPTLSLINVNILLNISLPQDKVLFSNRRHIGQKYEFGSTT